MPEVFSSAETSLELVDPITDAAIMAIPFLRDDSFSESPTYGPRGYHRSAAVSAARLRSKGTITIRKDAEGMAFAREVERWQKGIIWYPMGSDLKGKRFRHPHIRKVMTQPDGTKEYRTAYDVRLSDRTLSRPDAGLVSESFTFEVQGGFDSPGSDRGEPVRALDFHRSGPATYLSPDGLKTAGDGVARFGLPWVRRRNLFNSDFASWTKTAVVPTYGHPDPFGGNGAMRFTIGAGTYADIRQAIALPAGTYTASIWARSATATAQQMRVTVVDSTTQHFDNQTVPTVWTRILVTVTVTATSVSFRFTTTAAAPGMDVYLYLPQLDTGASTTPPQPTNATGVDLTHPLNGAGLVLEGPGRNLVQNSTFLTDAANWTNTTRITSATCPDSVFAGYTATNGLAATTAESDIYAISAGSAYTLSGWFLKEHTSGKARLAFLNDSLSVVGYSQEISPTATGVWANLSTSGTVPAGATKVVVQCITEGPSNAKIYYTDIQVENNPFRTSMMRSPSNGNGTRQPDLCGIVQPHNLLKWSEDFSNPAWSKTCVVTANVGTGPNDNATADQLAFLAGQFALQSDGKAVGTRTLTGSVWVKTLSGTASINLEISSAGIRTVKTESKTVTTEWQRFTITITGASTDTGVANFVIKALSSATVLAWGAQLVEGSHPGIYVPTTDTPILPPPSPALDPAWSQNGRIRFRVLPPPISTGKTYYLIGGPDASGRTFALWRNSPDLASNSAIIFDRKHNGATGSFSAAGRGALSGASAIYDGAPHDVELEWTNEINEATGVRQMWQRLYIDGVKVAEQDVAALYGATAWADIDPSRLVSDGNCFAVLSRVSLDRPTPRAGYRQVS